METTVKERQERKLLMADRCDRCGAQAFVLVKGVAGEIYFCGHHYLKNEEALIKFSYEIIDERNFINEKSSSSPI